MSMKYKLDVARDVDPDGDYGFVLNLDWGWRFSNELVHTRGYDTMTELRKAARLDVVPCNCDSCLKRK